MRVSRFIWPDDMTAAERAHVAAVEREIEIIGRRFTENDSGRRAFADVLVARLPEVCPPALVGRLRPVVGERESFVSNSIRRMGVYVRITWSRHEAERRTTERRAREERERLEEIQRLRREQQATGARRRGLTRMERDDLRARMSRDQWGSARDESGVCGICQADPSMWCDLVAHDQRGRRTISPSDVRSYRVDITVSRTELEDASRNDLDLMRRAIADADRLTAMSLDLDTSSLFTEAAAATSTGSSYGLASGRAFESRTARVVSLSAAVAGQGTIAILDDGTRARCEPGLAGIGIGELVRVSGAADRQVARPASGEEREFRREVLGEFVPRPNSTDTPRVAAADAVARAGRSVSHLADSMRMLRSSMAAVMPDTATARDLRRLEEVYGREPRPFAQMIAQQLPAPAWAPYPTFKMDQPIPGSLDERMAAALRARQREAVDLLVRIVIVALRARERTREGVELFLVFARGALEPWARNPSPIELDLEGRPAGGVDIANDDAASRFALLELK